MCEVELKSATIVTSDDDFRIIHGVRIDCLKVGGNEKAATTVDRNFPFGTERKIKLVNKRTNITIKYNSTSI